jgi:hypothetical protein
VGCVLAEFRYDWEALRGSGRRPTRCVWTKRLPALLSAEMLLSAVPGVTSPSSPLVQAAVSTLRAAVPCSQARRALYRALDCLSPRLGAAAALAAAAVGPGPPQLPDMHTPPTQAMRDAFRRVANLPTHLGTCLTALWERPAPSLGRPPPARPVCPKPRRCPRPCAGRSGHPRR